MQTDGRPQYLYSMLRSPESAEQITSLYVERMWSSAAIDPQINCKSGLVVFLNSCLRLDAKHIHQQVQC